MRGRTPTRLPSADFELGVPSLYRQVPRCMALYNDNSIATKFFSARVCRTILRLPGVTAQTAHHVILMEPCMTTIMIRPVCCLAG